MQDFHVYLPKMMTKVQRIKRKGSKSNLLKYQICPPNDTLIVHRDLLSLNNNLSVFLKLLIYETRVIEFGNLFKREDL